MSDRAPVDCLASIEDGSDLLAALLASDGLNYGAVADAPDCLRRDQGTDDWHETHVLDGDGRAIIRYIELGGSGSGPSFEDVTHHLQRHGSPVDELFTVVGSRTVEDGALTSSLTDDITFLSHAARSSSTETAAGFDLTYFTVDRFDPAPIYREFVERLAVDRGQDRQALDDDCQGVFSVEAMTRQFYESFDEIFGSALEPSVHGLSRTQTRGAYARTVVNRVLFLLFVAETGWLDGDTDYVQRRYERAAAEEHRDVYADWFEPLCFDALTEPGVTDDDFLGRIPFLNGGLFERRADTADVHIDEQFFDALLAPGDDETDDSMGLFRRYDFSLGESTPSERELVVDPEFVGRIFEMFMQDDERSAAGAFYTPKPITAYMTKNALRHHLVERTPLTHEQALTLVTTHSAESLTESTREAVGRTLRTVRVLDPAVGSGAFVVAMIEELVGVAEAVEPIAGEDRSRFDRKAAFLRDCLYGVDTDPGGIECCTLRVWLHLLQDVDRSHEAVLSADGVLPNLDCNFFVGNSLVGEHDPTRAGTGSSGEPLPDDLAETLEAFSETRDRYATAHGADRERLGARLDELRSTVERRLAVRAAGDWMDDVAPHADAPFAWTSTLPEVVLSGGFDIVIGNPPYEGQSQQAYVGALARHYDRAYDFYETIPRMRHDLYQKFVVRGWELTRPGGTLSYITSRTFTTIGSKQTTRALLQRNRLLELLTVAPATFDATVDPAIFSLRKAEASSEQYAVDYLDATEADIDSYRQLLAERPPPDEAVIDTADDGDDSDGRDHSLPTRLDVPGPTRGYRVPIETYRTSLRGAFFEPTAENVAFSRSVMAAADSLATEWADAIRDSSTVDDHLDAIRADHLSTLDPGDVSILGLLTVGGQGLATGCNDDYLAYLAGTPEAAAVRERNDDFSYGSTHDHQYRWMSRVIRPNDTVPVTELTDAERQTGIDHDTSRTWIPIIKGKGAPYYAPITEYIDWSTTALDGVRADGLVRNQRYYFDEGIFVSRGGSGDPVVRYAPPAAVDSSGGKYIPTFEQVSAKYLNGVLNSAVVQHVIDQFVNGTVNTQIQDMRVVPIVVPTDEQRARMESLVDEAIAIRVRETDVGDPVAELDAAASSSRSLAAVAAEIDDLVERIYDVPER